MKRQLIGLCCLFFSCMTLAHGETPNALSSQCDALQARAFALRDSQKEQYNFCRIEFINASARLGEACTALHQNRKNYANEVLQSAALFVNFADKANCKPKDETRQFRADILTLANTVLNSA